MFFHKINTSTNNLFCSANITHNSVCPNNASITVIIVVIIVVVVIALVIRFERNVDAARQQHPPPGLLLPVR